LTTKKEKRRNSYWLDRCYQRENGHVFVVQVIMDSMVIFYWKEG